MAYPNNYYPMFYQPQVPMPMQQPQQMQQQIQQPQIQNNGFISVPNEDMALNYPVAPGNCVTFKIEGKPIVMEKSMGFSQLESPRIERYRLVKEEPILAHTETKQEESIKSSPKNYEAEFERIWTEIETIKKDIVKPAKKKKEVNEDDADAES